MKKLLYICALFVLQSQAQTHSFASAEKSVREPVKASATTYYLKATGELTRLSSWGTNADGSGNAPTSFLTEDTYMVTNRTGDVRMDGDWSVRNVEIANDISLSVADHTLTLTGGSIRYSRNAKIKGSPKSSVIVDSSLPLELIFDNSAPGTSNGLKNLTISLGVKAQPATLTLLSDLHIYNQLELKSGDLVIGNNDVYLKTNSGKDAEFEAPGLLNDKANIYYNGTGRFVIEHLKADGKNVVSLIAHPFTEQSPNVDDAGKEEGLIFGATADQAETEHLEKELSKNQIKDDIELFLQNKFWDIYTRPANLENIFC